jgi:hypothetical protein
VNSVIQQIQDGRSSRVVFFSALIASMPLCHWIHYHPGDSVRLELVQRVAPSLVMSELHSHSYSQGATLPARVLHALVDSTAHYLVGFFPRQGLGESQSILPILLAQMFAKSDQIDTPLNRTMTVILAAAAFATHPYPGGEESSQDLDSYEHRALQLLQHYQDNAPGEHRLHGLFKFGFIGLVHRLDFALLGKDNAVIAAVPAVWTKVSDCEFPFNDMYSDTDIHGLPPTFTLETHMMQAASRCLLSVAQDSFPWCPLA